jgi:hypothetical protein
MWFKLGSSNSNLMDPQPSSCDGIIKYRGNSHSSDKLINGNHVENLVVHFVYEENTMNTHDVISIRFYRFELCPCVNGLILNPK